MIRIHADEVSSPGPQHDGRADHRPRRRRPRGCVARVEAETVAPRRNPPGVCPCWTSGLIREQPEAVERALADKGGAALVQEVRRPRHRATPAHSPGRRAQAPSGTAPPRRWAGSSPRRGRRPRCASRCARSRTDQDARRPAQGRRRGGSGARCSRSRTCRTLGAAGQERRRQRRGAALGHAARVRLRAEAARGGRRGARAARLRARRPHRQGALRRAVGRGGAARAGARPVHARPAHARARLHRGLGAAPRQRARPCSAPAQLPKFEEELFKTVEPDDGRHALSDPDRRGAADRPAHAARSSTASRAAAAATPPSRRATAREAGTLRQGHAASSASTSSTRSSW